MTSARPVLATTIIAAVLPIYYVQVAGNTIPSNVALAYWGYTAALARYEAAVSSDDKAIRARLGIARSQLFLEKVADAQAALLALQKEHPKNATVAYWLARSAEVAGKRDIAKDAYEVAIAEGGAGPDAARSYVALAQLLRQEGALDDAAKLLVAVKAIPASAAGGAWD